MTSLRHFLTVGDLSASELQQVLKWSHSYKQNRSHGRGDILKEKIIGLLFQKASTRTRVSFEVGVQELGGSSIFLGREASQLGRGETLLDSLLVLERYLAGLIIRNHDHQAVLEASRHVKVPLINGLSETHHPAQGVADAFTVMEYMQEKNKSGRPQLAYLGEGNNVTISLIEICSLLQWPLKVACPSGYNCSPAWLQGIILDERVITFTEDPIEAVTGAEGVYTDTWFSMGEGKGQDEKSLAKQKALLPYQVNTTLMKHANPDYIFMHCLPAYREQEVTTEIIDGPHSRIYEQAGNRLHVQKALLYFLFQHVE